MGSKLLNKITNIYIFVIIVIFPLLVDRTGYFHILECKWLWYLIIFIIYIIALIIVIIYELRVNEINYLKQIKFKDFHILLFIYLLVIIISYIFSPFRNTSNLLIGPGRGEGLLITIIYILSALFISLFGRFKKEYLVYVSISGILVSIIGLLQYAGYNPFYLYKNNLGFHNCFYISTIGNIDTLSAYYCICISSSFVGYLFFDNTKKNNYVHLMSLFLSFFIFSIINVDSGKVAIVCSFILSLPIVISNNKLLQKLMNVLIVFLSGYAFNVFLNSKYYLEKDKIMIDPTINKIFLLFLFSILMIVILKKKIIKSKYKFSNDKLKKTYYLIVLGFVLFLLFVYFIKIDNKLIMEIRLLLHGDFRDEIGSYRIFLWKRTLNLVKYYPILGTGPDSFVISFMKYYSNDIMKIGPLTRNDTAANVYLTILINYGIVGLITYLTLMFCIMKKCINGLNKDKKFLVIILVCYLIQDFFNLSVVIISPLFWCLIGIILTSLNNEKQVDLNY